MGQHVQLIPNLFKQTYSLFFMTEYAFPQKRKKRKDKKKEKKKHPYKKGGKERAREGIKKK